MVSLAAKEQDILHCILANGEIAEEAAWVHRRQQALDNFLANVERSAFRMAEISTRNREDALDIVQDAMIKFVSKYKNKPESEWRPLFYATLRSRITDFHRKKTVWARIFSWHSEVDSHFESTPEIASSDPLAQLAKESTSAKLQTALKNLPLRQQEAFLLRIWQGFSVAETSKIMKCAEGSVKTHLFRANEALKLAIDEDIKSEEGKRDGK